MVHLHSLATVRGNRICTRAIEGVAISHLEVIGRGVDVAFPEIVREATATARREEIRHLVWSTPSRDFEGLEAFRPGRAGVVPDVDSSLDARSTASVAEGIDDEGRAACAEGGHGCERRGDGELHFV